MACYVLIKKYIKIKKIITRHKDDSTIYKFNNYFEATFL